MGGEIGSGWPDVPAEISERENGKPAWGKIISQGKQVTAVRRVTTDPYIARGHFVGFKNIPDLKLRQVDAGAEKLTIAFDFEVREPNDLKLERGEHVYVGTVPYPHSLFHWLETYPGYIFDLGAIGASEAEALRLYRSVFDKVRHTGEKTKKLKNEVYKSLEQEFEAIGWLPFERGAEWSKHRVALPIGDLDFCATLPDNIRGAETSRQAKRVLGRTVLPEETGVLTLGIKRAKLRFIRNAAGNYAYLDAAALGGRGYGTEASRRAHAAKGIPIDIVTVEPDELRKRVEDYREAVHRQNLNWENFTKLAEFERAFEKASRLERYDMTNVSTWHHLLHCANSEREGYKQAVEILEERV